LHKWYRPKEIMTRIPVDCFGWLAGCAAPNLQIGWPCDFSVVK